jgi:hypothetical protein
MILLFTDVYNATFSKLVCYVLVEYYISVFLFFMLCGLQVLRLWLERKIFPESVLRRYMNDIGGSGDDKTVKLSFRRPSRAERSVDDPIREMEGMLVDEYGRCGYWGHHFF